MTVLAHFPEPKPAHGALVAEGALNLLGRPEMDPLVVLMREVVQNSWDARSSRYGTVHFAVDLRRIEPGQRAVLRESVFVELPPKGLGAQGQGEVELSDALTSEDLRLLVLTDTGTRGLGGPVRADVPLAEGECSDFVDLVFNIGQPRDREFGGGTYGFGKTISYLVSQCRTVLIHTVTEYRHRIEHRLIAQAIGHQYSHRSRNFTGRHWWGTVKPHGVEPLVGRTAERLAAKLGLPALERGGTTLAVVAPIIGSREPVQAATFMAHSIAWNFWPKMIREGRKRAMEFTVACDGKRIAIPDPETTPPLDAFVDALRAARDCDSGRQRPSDFPAFHVFELKSERPKASLGWLALHPVPAKSRPKFDEGVDDQGEPTSAAGFAGPAHHVALMRRAELVVQYRPGPELPNPAVEWAGVFKASESTDAAFAEAEPPTHDDWCANLVSDSWHRRYVNVAQREMREKISAALGASMGVPDTREPRSGVVVADALGHLIATTSGAGPSRPRADRPDGHGPRAKAPKITVLGRSFTTEGGRSILNVTFTVSAAIASSATVIDVTAGVAMADGGAMESDPPAGATVPAVLGFRQGTTTVVGSQLRIPAGDESPIVVSIVQVPSAATVVDIRPAPAELST